MADIESNWRLEWEGAPTVPVEIDARPSLWVEEVRQKDGSILPGNHYWNLITADMAYSLPLWEGRINVLLTLRDESGWETERWMLKNARNVHNGKQVAIAFDGVSRLK